MKWAIAKKKEYVGWKNARDKNQEQQNKPGEVMVQKKTTKKDRECIN